MAFVALTHKLATDSFTATDYNQIADNFEELNFRSTGGGGETPATANQIIVGSADGTPVGLTLPNGAIVYGTASGVQTFTPDANSFLRWTGTAFESVTQLPTLVFV